MAHNYELIGRLASGIVHDFNKLLTVILGNLSLLQSSLAANASQRPLLSAIENTANQAADLTRQLLALARHETFRVEPVDLNAVAEQVASLLRHTIDPRVELVVRPRAGLSWVQADPGRMTRVLLNLCLNACDAMPRGGRLHIATDEVRLGPAETAANPGRAPGLYVRLTVEDTGAGIPEEVRPRIFDPFFSTKQPGAGTGLGLSIVANLVREHGGWVDCISAPGRGARFDVYLPELRQIAGVQQSTSAATGATVMIVDAEEPIRELARTVLEQNGYRVVVAVDGRQAVEALCREESKAALVLLDVHAAPSSGGDTLDELWALDREVRVLLMNSQLPAATFEKGAKNVHGFLVKPFRPADLLAAVRAALETSRHEGGADAREQGAPASGAEEVAPQVPR